MATISQAIEECGEHLIRLNTASERGDAEAMYEACRAALGTLSKLLARFAVLMDLRQEATFAAEVDRALNRKL